ncbi:MAG: acetyl-CoA carboxylase biotin carboxyl carrier protein [Planctomycetes bacterium]|nr:acetyl-CoA carboxylase biotin carboxyl carrier protein [Planctomycetota bacterium]
MDLIELRKLVQLMLRADLSELELDDKNSGLRVHLRRERVRAHGEGSLSNLVQVMPAGMQAAAQGHAAPVQAGPAPAAGTEIFKSPIVGTFYRSSAPDAEPFMVAGTRFNEATVLCIIEAMKVMNEIRAEFGGEIVEVLAENGEPVEFGQPLFLIKKG